jgi:O-acetyl-ADP-ribose deacetylase (regulator of RNase III)
MENLDFLIDYLLKENSNINIEEMPKTMGEKENLWRALCNIRDAKSISDEYLKIQDEFLQKRLETKKITDVYDLKTIPNSNIISLWQGDITKLKIDAIVNAANSQGLGCFQPLHNCIDNQIQTYSGVQMRLECDKYMKTIDYKLRTGKAFITKGYNLPAKYVIHTVGPIINYKVSENDKRLLKDCYKNSLKLAQENGIKTIAFPCISTGVFRFPKDLAVMCAFSAVDEFINESPNSIEKIVFNVYGEEDLEIYEQYVRQNF